MPHKALLVYVHIYASDCINGAAFILANYGKGQGRRRYPKKILCQFKIYEQYFFS